VHTRHKAKTTKILAINLAAIGGGFTFTTNTPGGVRFFRIYRAP